MFDAQKLLADADKTRSERKLEFLGVPKADYASGLYDNMLQICSTSADSSVLS